MKQKAGDQPAITILGLTFKENVPDLRSIRVIDIIAELERFDIRPQVRDPRVDADEAEYGNTIVREKDLKPADGIILAVAHHEFATGGWKYIADLLTMAVAGCLI